MSTADILDYYRRRNEIRQTYPDDLLEDLQEEEPALYNEAQECDSYIADYKRQLNSSVAPRALLPSIVTAGWDLPKKKKFSQNWPDMENLLKLYALGLYFRGKAMPYQAEYDQKELSDVIQKASISPKCKKGIPAQKRLEKAKTYLRFGIETLNIFFKPDSYEKEYDMAALDTEISETSNEHNAAKLAKSKHIALQVGRFICARYNNLNKE